MNLYKLTIAQAQTLLKNKEISALELTHSLLNRIHVKDQALGAYITIADEMAIKSAQAADSLIAKGKIRPLTGIPLALKDLICTQGIRTTCASKILENFIPPYDAFVVKGLKEDESVILGKTNMDEFAMGSTTENSGLQTTSNPWDSTRIPGGSSGGSAVAVAADLALGALGSDTGGSIRQPASHCGVVGMKPTYGRVSRQGLVAFASSLDQIGPLTKDVTDCAILMNAISGYDPGDSTSVNQKVPDFTAALEEGLQGLTIGIPVEYNQSQGLDPEVKTAVQQSIKILENLGAQTIEVNLPHSPYVVAVYYVIAPSEASSNLSRYDGVKYGLRVEESVLGEMYNRTRSQGFGAEVQRRIIIGTYCLSAGYYDAYYGKALQVRTLITTDFKKAFENCDVIISPVAPSPAFPIGEVTNDPLKMYLSDLFTLAANLAGIPGISIPCGFSAQGLPIGVQLLGNHFNEAILLKTAYNFEKATDFHQRKPVI